MAKFCVYCGAPLEETSGQCPLCEREQPNLSEPKPMVWPTVKGEKAQKQTQQEPFAHAQEWLSQESPVWQEEPQDEQVPQQEKPPEERKEPLQPVQHQEQAQEAQAKAQDTCEVLSGEDKERQAAQPESSELLFSMKEEENPTADGQNAESEKHANETLQALHPEGGDEKEPEQVVQEDDFGEENDESRKKSEEAKRPAEHQAMQQAQSDEARQLEYENTFSEMLQDFSEEQEQNAAPPQPKYLPAATYEERPEPTTAGILGTLVLSMVPIVGWILLLVWAFDGQAAVFQKRLARALLLFKLILWLVLLIAGALTAYISYEIIQMSAYSAFAFSGMT